MKTLVALSALALASISSALSFDDIQNWTGTGTNRAAFVIDWNDGKNPESLVWGYRFTGTATGENMLNAILGANPALTASLVNYSGFGVSVNGFNYGAHAQSGFGSSYWAYYTSNAGSVFPTAWTYSSVGATGRNLVDGSWDGWSFGTYPNETAPSPAVAAAPVPEPASLAAFALGGLALLRRRRR